MRTMYQQHPSFASLPLRRVVVGAVLLFVLLVVLATLDSLRPHHLSKDTLTRPFQAAKTQESEAIWEGEPTDYLIDGEVGEAVEEAKNKWPEVHVTLSWLEEEEVVDKPLSTPESVSSTSPSVDSSKPLTKTLVIPSLLEQLEETSWTQEVHGWDIAVYVVDLPEDEASPTGYKTPFNKAREVTPYLTYIIEHYDNFPDIAAFVHAHRSSWHTDAPDGDIVKALHQLREQAVIEHGFVNLRCYDEPGCPAEVNFHRGIEHLGNPLYPQTEILYPNVYARLFNTTTEYVREEIRAVGALCCAQFAVTRDEVRKRDKAEYEWFLKCVEESRIDDHSLGMVMEYTWHIIFGRNATNCGEGVDACYEDLFGGPPTEWLNEDSTMEWVNGIDD